MLKSAVAAPLRSAERGVIGVLVLGSSLREGAFSPEDVTVLQGLADQATLGLERARLYQEQKTQAMTDALTGLANLRQLELVLAQELARSKRASSEMSVIFSDLDGFKEVNDRFGHSVGDAALKLYAGTLVETLRAGDVAARYGGDEFVCVLPGADLAHAQAVAERLQRHFAAQLSMTAGLSQAQTSVSVGIAVYPADGTTAEELLAAADANLIAAKPAVHPRPIPLRADEHSQVHVYARRPAEVVEPVEQVQLADINVAEEPQAL
jgi:diguanylate cyclase (GGDEF)-like protein